MAISPVAGMIYANQGMQAPATQQAEFQQRLDAQANAAMATSNEEKKEIEEVRPTEETLELDPENDQEKEKNESKKEAKKGSNEDEEDFTPKDDIDHLLDITI